MTFFKDLVPHRMLFKVNQNIDQSNIQDATETLVLLVETYPNFAPAYNVLGFLYANAFNDPMQSLPCYRKALELDSQYAPTYFNLLVALNATGNLNQVPEIAQKAMALKGIDLGKIFYCLGMMHELKNEFELAKAQFQKAMYNSVLDSEIAQYRAAYQRCDLKHSLAFQ